MINTRFDTEGASWTAPEGEPIDLEFLRWLEYLAWRDLYADKDLNKVARPREFERFVGHKVKVTLREPVDNQRHWVGALSGFTEGIITLEPAPGKSIRFPLEQVERANLKFEW